MSIWKDNRPTPPEPTPSYLIFLPPCETHAALPGRPHPPVYVMVCRTKTVFRDAFHLDFTLRLLLETINSTPTGGSVRLRLTASSQHRRLHCELNWEAS